MVMAIYDQVDHPLGTPTGARNVFFSSVLRGRPEVNLRASYAL